VRGESATCCPPTADTLCESVERRGGDDIAEASVILSSSIFRHISWISRAIYEYPVCHTYPYAALFDVLSQLSPVVDH
jgi:hypothetical protein